MTSDPSPRPDVRPASMLVPRSLLPAPMLVPRSLLSVLDDVGALGPFFVLEVAAPDGSPVPFARLHDDPAPLADRIARVGESLGADDRVAASIAFQGLVARLVAAPLAAVVAHAVLPDTSGLARFPDGPDPWAPVLTSTDATRTPDPVRDPAGAAAPLAGSLLDGVVAPLVEAVRALVPVSAHVLWGNVASSLSGAGRVLDPARPALRPALLGVLEALLAHPSLAGTGRLLRLEPERPDTEWGFRRRSCCLYYRVPGGGICGDCVLNDPRR